LSIPAPIGIIHVESRRNPMNLIFLGPPGAGKGTVAELASTEFGIPHISTGEIFRASIRNGTELGKRVKSIIDSGGLVPDEVTIGLVKDRLAQPDVERGWILDGFPRTVAQARALDAMTAYDAAVDFTIGNEEVVERLSGRRVCRKCSRNFHVSFLPPKAAGVCDGCGGELYVRDDDKEESIRTRLDVYRTKTEPLIDYFRERGKLLEIDARPAPDKVMDRLRASLKEF
jgi:adenylate kinase